MGGRGLLERAETGGRGSLETAMLQQSVHSGRAKHVGLPTENHRLKSNELLRC